MAPSFPPRRSSELRFARSTVETIILLGVIAPIGLPQVYGNFGADIANVVVSLRHSGLSRADAAALERGYYEGLTRVNRFNSQLLEIYMNRPNGGWPAARGSGLTRMRDDFLQPEMPQDCRPTPQHGTNQTKPCGTRHKAHQQTP